MPIKNKTKNRILANNIRFCRNFLNKSVGLIFHKKLKDKGLIFVYRKKRKVSLHMVFVFFPIDVLFLDESKRVTEIKENFKPFHFYIAKKEANYILELPEGVIKKTKIEVGDKISF